MIFSMGTNMYMTIYLETNNRHRFYFPEHISGIKNHKIAAVGYSGPIKI